jgi:hypothetical protein
MKYAVEMGSGAMIYIPSFIEIGSAIQKLMGGGGTQTPTDVDHKTLHRFFKTKEGRQKMRLSENFNAGFPLTPCSTIMSSCLNLNFIFRISDLKEENNMQEIHE